MMKVKNYPVEFAFFSSDDSKAKVEKFLRYVKVGVHPDTLEILQDVANKNEDIFETLAGAEDMEKTLNRMFNAAKGVDNNDRSNNYRSEVDLWNVLDRVEFLSENDEDVFTEFNKVFPYSEYTLVSRLLGYEYSHIIRLNFFKTPDYIDYSCKDFLSMSFHLKDFL